MDYKKQKHTMKVERTILLVYTAFTALVLIMAPLFCDDIPVYVIAVVSPIIAWITHVKKYKTYRFRALLVSGLMLVSYSLHAMYASNLFGILPTFGALVVLLAVYALPEVVYQELVFFIFLLLYHGFYLRTFPFVSAGEICRNILQTFAVFATIGITHYLVILRKNTEAELWENIADLEKAERSKTDFMANVSHEIRTPLNTISGMSEMLLKEKLTMPARETVSDIQAAGRRLQLLVSDILDFSELESGKMTLVEETYNITSTINDVINMCIAQKGEKQVELIVDCDPNIPCGLVGDEQKLRRVIMNLMNNALKFTNQGCVILQVTCRQEEYGINLIIRIKDTGIGIKEENLERLFTTFNQVDTRKNRAEGGIGLGLAISNSIVKKMEGFITVDSVFGEGTQVQVVIPQRVTNNAPIVSIERSKEVFGAVYINMEKYQYNAMREGYKQSIVRMSKQLNIPFERCRNLHELKNKCEKKSFTHIFIGWDEFCEDKSFFEEMSMSVQVVLILERDMAAYVGGRIQCIYKPFYVLSIAAVLNGERVLQSGDLIFEQGNRFIAPDANVLVVDDNLMNLKVVEGLLRPYQIKVFTAVNGKEALTKIESMKYDFVFMDHMMPEMDGVETLHKLRQKPGRYYAEVPVIALTANAIGGVREMFLEEGFQDFMAKPIEMSVMERMLRKYLPEYKILTLEEVAAEAAEANARREEEQEPGLQNYGGAAGYRNTNVLKEYDKEFDMESGVGRCGGMDNYEKIAQLFHNSAKENMEKIEFFYREKDWKNYTVLVHALKSSALYVGAANLSEQAKNLESAAKEGRTEYIENHQVKLMELYQRLLSRMEDCEQLQLRDEKEERTADHPNVYREVEKEELYALFAKLQRLFEDFDSLGVEDLLKEMSGYRYLGRPLSVVAERLGNKVLHYDFIGAAEILEAAMEEFR